MVLGLAGCAGQPRAPVAADTGAAPVNAQAAAASAADALQVAPGPGRADNQLYTALGGLPHSDSPTRRSASETLRGHRHRPASRSGGVRPSRVAFGRRRAASAPGSTSVWGNRTQRK